MSGVWPVSSMNRRWSASQLCTTCEQLRQIFFESPDVGGTTVTVTRGIKDNGVVTVCHASIHARTNVGASFENPTNRRIGQCREGGHFVGPNLRCSAPHRHARLRRPACSCRERASRPCKRRDSRIFSRRPAARTCSAIQAQFSACSGKIPKCPNSVGFRSN